MEAILFIIAFLVVAKVISGGILAWHPATKNDYETIRRDSSPWLLVILLLAIIGFLLITGSLGAGAIAAL